MTEREDLTRISKFLSLVLRHSPDSIGLKLDPAGWASVTELISCARAHGNELDEMVIRRVVATSDKRRFGLSEDGLRIRANQGHSIEVNLGLAPTIPPDTLFHGTADRFVDSIFREGLMPGERQHVHLSSDPETALQVGQRHGRAVVLIVDARLMTAGGSLFFLSENGVWLTDRVAPEFLRKWTSSSQGKECFIS